MQQFLGKEYKISLYYRKCEGKTKNEREIIYKFIKDNNLDFEKIFEYANKIGNIKPIKKLYELGGKNE